MNATLIGLIGLLTLAYTFFLKEFDSSDVGNDSTQISDTLPIEYEEKVLGATYRQGRYVGNWYEQEGRLEIFRSSELVKILYLVDKGRAEFHFRRWIRENQ